MSDAQAGALYSRSKQRYPMQILLHSDPHTDGSHLMSEHLKVVVTDAMAHFGERVKRVEAHLSDVSSPGKSGAADIHCTLEARLGGLDAVVVKHHSGNAHQAIDGAVRKLRRAVGSQIAKHDDPRGQRGLTVAPDTDTRNDLKD